MLVVVGSYRITRLTETLTDDPGIVVDLRSDPVSDETASALLVDAARRLRDAFAAADTAALDGMLADSVLVRVPGRHRLSGLYRGRDTAYGLLGLMLEWTHGTLEVEFHDLLAGSDHVAVLATVSADHMERRLEQRSVCVLRLAEGRVVETSVWHEDQEAVDAFFA